MHTLFALEDLYGLSVSESDGLVCLKIDKEKNKEARELFNMLNTWKKQADKLASGEISQDEYDDWRYYYPHFETFQYKQKVGNNSKIIPD